METQGPGRRSESFPVEQRVLKLQDWPPAILISLGRATERSQGLFGYQGRASDWAGDSFMIRTRVLGRYLNWCRCRGMPCDKVEGLVTPERIVAYRKDCAPTLSAHTQNDMLRGMRCILEALDPASDWTWLTSTAIRPSKTDIRASKKKVTTFDVTALARSVVEFMETDEHRIGVRRSVNTMVVYRDALMTLFQCLFALRKRNLAGLWLGRNLLMEGAQTRLLFSEAETKNYARIDYLLPVWVLPMLSIYLDRYRPQLLGGACTNALWVNRSGQPLAYEGVAPAFRAIGQRWVGRPINCHNFRHSAATTWLRHNPSSRT